MKPQLKTSLTSWLSRNGLDTDLSILSQDEWRFRNESYLNEAELVIISEGGLCILLNYTLHTPQYEEFEDLLASFGYYYELGYTWCLGLYSTGEEVECDPYFRYSQKLRDQRWQIKRRIVLDRAKGKCEDCSSPTTSLEVHHCYYMARCQPWQYPLDSLRALCRPCHEYRAVIESRIMGLLAHVAHPVLDDVYGTLQKQIYREK